MKRYEYKTVILEVKRDPGLWTSKVNSSSVKPIEDKLNKLGREGWLLVGVFPVTDGGSPAQISKAVHHFTRELVD